MVVHAYFLEKRHAGCCETWQKRNQNRQKRVFFVLFFENLTTSQVFKSQSINIENHFTFILPDNEYTL